MKTFEIEVSWTMTTNIYVEAETEEEAECYALTTGQPDGGSFVPLSMDVGSIEVVDGEINGVPARLIRIK